jgi:glycosyltransferase involved in cell wall biosynthesis
LAHELGVIERVHFRGAVGHERLPDLLRAGDFLLFTTQPPESFGIVLIEAMACGLPVVATEYPGVRAVVDPEENGFLAPVGDLDRIIAAVRLMVARGPEGRAAMGAAGRAKCERTWSWPRLAERMDRVYADAIAAHGGEAR